MTDSTTVHRKSRGQDADGNETETVVDFGPYPCRLEARRNVPLETAQGGSLVAVTVWSAYFPVGTDIRPDDTLTINGTVYEVSDQTGARTDAAFVLVTLRRIS